MLEVKYDGQPVNTHLCIAQLDSFSQLSVKAAGLSDILKMFVLLSCSLKANYNISEKTLMKAVLINSDDVIEESIKIDVNELKKTDR